MHCLYFTTHLCLFASVFLCVYFIQSDEMPVFCFSHTDISHVFFSCTPHTESHRFSRKYSHIFSHGNFSHFFLTFFSLKNLTFVFPRFFSHKILSFFSHRVLTHILTLWVFARNFFDIFLLFFSHMVLIVFSHLFSHVSLFLFFSRMFDRTAGTVSWQRRLVLVLTPGKGSSVSFAWGKTEMNCCECSSQVSSLTGEQRKLRPEHPRNFRGMFLGRGSRRGPSKRRK